MLMITKPRHYHDKVYDHTISFKVTTKQSRKLSRVASKQKKAMSQVIRDLIDKHL